MYFYKNLEKVLSNEKDRNDYIYKVIQEFKKSEQMRIFLDADNYDNQLNTTIMNAQKTFTSKNGMKFKDNLSPNNKIASNFFNQFITQGVQYLLGNGVFFKDDLVAQKLGMSFDTTMQKGARLALVHGKSFGFWNVDKLHFFNAKEFIPFYDEFTGSILAGIRFFDSSENDVINVTIYEIDGFTDLIFYGEKDVVVRNEKTSYKKIVKKTKFEIIGTEFHNYGKLPIFELKGNSSSRSELVGCKNTIDLYDRIFSDFGNDFDRNQAIVWIIKSFDGMSSRENSEFINNLKTNNVISIDSRDGGDVDSKQIEIPHEARAIALEMLEKRLYKDYGALDIESIKGGATATQIRANYLPVDAKADELEYELIDFIQNILDLIGLSGTPAFKRNKIVDELAEVQKIVLASQFLDDETVLKLLPFIPAENVQEILKRKRAEIDSKFATEDLEYEN